MKSQIGPIQEHYSVKGVVLHYYTHVLHSGLNKSRVIKASSPGLVATLAEVQAKEWEEKWREICAKQAARDEKASQIWNRNQNQNTAAERTAEAQERLDEITNIISSVIDKASPLEWDKVKNFAYFAEKKPKPPTYPAKPVPKDVGPEPLGTMAKYQPRIGFFDTVFGQAKNKTEAANKLLANDHSYWEKEKASADQAFEIASAQYESECSKLKKEYEADCVKWEQDKVRYYKERDEQNALIDSLKEGYLKGDPESIIHYNETVLSRSDYPECFPKEFEMEYIPDTKTLIVEYLLPDITALPTLKEVKFIQSKEEFQEKVISQAELNRTFDEVIYQTALRTMYEIYKADAPHYIDAIVFNGIVNYIDKTSGHDASACIVSIQTIKEEFLAINLGLEEAKACFKNLKGVASSKLHGISPVAPIMAMQREDNRFVAAHDVTDQMDDSTNLAAMDWQDFEHLIRELFGKEFSSTGGEVKITQASRDGGVDAVAFDPDPIRGGKIVIQAKRYTNTVTVSAVRDLYGTVMNEGANKGVLVTTSDYGPDAYAFAKDKPLVLLNGANLLHLLEKHGHKARIDIKEAKLQQQQ
jgi:restriction system protein